MPVNFKLLATNKINELNAFVEENYGSDIAIEREIRSTLNGFTLGILNFNEVSVPHVVPLNTNKAQVFFSRNPSEVLEFISLEILQNAAPNMCHFHFVDFNTYSSFGKFKALEVLGLTYNFTEFDKLLLNLTDYKKSVAIGVLSEKHKTLKNYIEDTGSSKYKSQFIFISNYTPDENQHRRIEQEETLKDLIKESNDCGLFIFLASKKKGVFDFLPNEFINKIDLLDAGNQFFKIPKTTNFVKINFPNFSQRSSEIFEKLNTQSDSQQTQKGISIPVGTNAYNRRQILSFEPGYRNYYLITGSGGEGKSNLVDVLIYNGAKKYSSSELHFYILDFKSQSTDFEVFREYPHVKFLSTSPKFALLAIKTLLDSFETKRQQKTTLPETFLIIDEAPSVLKNPKVSALLEEVVQKSRAFNIKLIMTLVSLDKVDIPEKNNVRGLFSFQRGDYQFGALPFLSEDNDIVPQFKEYHRSINNVTQGSAIMVVNSNDRFILKVENLVEGNDAIARSRNRQKKVDELLDKVRQGEPSSIFNERIIFPELEVRSIRNNLTLWANISNKTFQKSSSSKTVFIGGGLENLGEQVKFELSASDNNNISIYGPSLSENSRSCFGQVMFQLLSQNENYEVKIIDFSPVNERGFYSPYLNQFNDSISTVEIKQDDQKLEQLVVAFTEWGELLNQRQNTGDSVFKNTYICLLGFQSIFDPNVLRNPSFRSAMSPLISKLFQYGPQYGIHFIILTESYQDVLNLQNTAHLNRFTSYLGYQIGFAGGGFKSGSYALEVENEIGGIVNPIGDIQYFSLYTNEGWI